MGYLEVRGWLLGFYGAIRLIGFPSTVPFFLFVYAKVYRAHWLPALSLAAYSWGLAYGVFEFFLHVPWPEPLLF